jgi:hypothetical protein
MESWPIWFPLFNNVCLPNLIPVVIIEYAPIKLPSPIVVSENLLTIAVGWINVKNWVDGGKVIY